MPKRAVQHSTESILLLVHTLTSEQTCLLGSATFTEQPHGIILQDTTPHWHIWLITVTQWWCRQSRREKAREGGLFSSAYTSRAADFTQSKTHGRGSHPPPALPASVTPATIPLVSQQAVDFITVVLLMMCGVCIFSWFADTVKYALQCDICLEDIYWQCRLWCKIHTCRCQGLLSKYEQNEIAAPLWLWAVCVLFQLGDSEVPFLAAANVIIPAGLSLAACSYTKYSFKLNQSQIFGGFYVWSTVFQYRL